MRRKVTVDDLPDKPSHGVVLKCTGECQGEFSATRGDYFWMLPGAWFRCSDCQGRPFLQLVRKVITYEYVPITRARVYERETLR